MTRIFAFLALAGALVGASTWIYLRAEPPVPGRGRLAVLRGAALVIIAALVADLGIPASLAHTNPGRWVLLDVSASMTAGDGAAWVRALARARELEASGWRVLPFAQGPRASGAGTETPDGARTELAPALRRAVEAGATEVRVLSDMRFMDRAAVDAELAALPAAVAFESFAASAPNAGVGPFRVEGRASTEGGTGAEMEIFAEGAGDSLDVVVLEDGAPILTQRVAAPPPGRRWQVRLGLPPARGDGLVRYTAKVVMDGDGFPADDEAVAYASVDRDEGGVVIVSLRPDWEPRAVLQVLEASTGMRARGFLRVGPDRFVTLGRGVDRGAPAGGAEVRQATAAADLLVLHGLAAGDAAWARGALQRRGPLVAWPADAGGAALLGLSATGRQEGEWLVVPDLPPSPLLPGLGGVDFGDLPPLGGVVPVGPSGEGAAVFRVRRGGTGAEAPGMIVQDGGEGRRVVVLAQGLWRWGARDGTPGEAYRRLWAAAAGWVLAGEPVAGELRPQRWVVPAGESVAWRVPASEGGAVRLEVSDGAGSVVLDTLLVDGLPGAATPPLPPGTYRYRGGPQDAAAATGRFDVEARTEEMAFLPRIPEATIPRAAAPPGDVGRRPLRASALPYLLILVLLSGEWVARRRAGLR